MTSNNALGFATALETALETARENTDVNRKAGIITGTAYACIGRLFNAASAVFTAQQGGKAAPDAVQRRLDGAANVVAALLPTWQHYGVNVNEIGNGIVESIGQARAGRPNAALDAAKAEALEKVMQAGGASAVAMASARATAEDKVLAANKDRIKAAAAALSKAGNGDGPGPLATIAAEYERCWEAAQRQAAWAVESLQRTRLPSRVAALGAEAAEYAQLAAEFEQLATEAYAAAYAAADAEAGAEVAAAAAAVAAVFDL